MPSLASPSSGDNEAEPAGPPQPSWRKLWADIAAAPLECRTRAVPVDDWAQQQPPLVEEVPSPVATVAGESAVLALCKAAVPAGATAVEDPFVPCAVCRLPFTCFSNGPGGVACRDCGFVTCMRCGSALAACHLCACPHRLVLRFV